MLNGRDIKDLNAFKIGEEFFPVGPRKCQTISSWSLLTSLHHSIEEAKVPVCNQR